MSADCAHSFGANRKGKMAGELADFSSFSFHRGKPMRNSTSITPWMAEIAEYPVRQVYPRGIMMPRSIGPMVVPTPQNPWRKDMAPVE